MLTPPASAEMDLAVEELRRRQAIQLAEVMASQKLGLVDAVGSEKELDKLREQFEQEQRQLEDATTSSQAAQKAELAERLKNRRTRRKKRIAEAVEGGEGAAGMAAVMAEDLREAEAAEAELTAARGEHERLRAKIEASREKRRKEDIVVQATMAKELEEVAAAAAAAGAGGDKEAERAVKVRLAALTAMSEKETSDLKAQETLLRRTHQDHLQARLADRQRRLKQATAEVAGAAEAEDEVVMQTSEALQVSH